MNELEYIKGEIFANVWGSNYIVRIDPDTGRVVGVIDLTGLLPTVDRAPTPTSSTALPMTRGGPVVRHRQTLAQIVRNPAETKAKPLTNGRQLKTIRQFNTMRSNQIPIFLGLLTFACSVTVFAEIESGDDYAHKFHPEKAPAPPQHFLKANDRLAICGDSITEQKMYSRIMETYLTVCAPELEHHRPPIRLEWRARAGAFWRG